MNIFKTLSKTIVLITLFCIFSTIAYPRSVYVITDHEDSDISAYEIVDDQISYQIQMDPPLDFGFGAVGLALDPCSSTLFTSYDDADKIGTINAKTLETIKSINTTVQFAGLVFDTVNQRLLAAQRETTKLYVYLWDMVTKTLTLDCGIPKTLYNLGGYGAYALALDEVESILYVTNRTNEVKYYDADDPNFGYLGSVDITVGGSNRAAVGIAVYNDGQGTKYLYTGAWSHSGTHNYLVRTDISDVNNPTSTERNIGASVIGITADRPTGYVYITTSNNHIEVYNPANWPGAPCDTEASDIDGPADIIVRGDVLYKPPVFDVNKVDNVNDVDCVYPWNMIDENYLVYNICYDANGYADTNVVISDYLPVEVDYYSSSSDPCGYYDPNTHTVTWDINDISGADSNCLQLTVKVNQYARPGEAIINLCEMEGNQYYNSATIVTDICCYGGSIIYVNQDADDPNSFHNGTSWLDAYTDLQEALHTARKCGCEQIWVAEGTHKPTKRSDTDARAVSFELPSNVAIYGGFPNTGDPNWYDRDWQTHITTLSGDVMDAGDKSDNSYHVVKCVDVNNAVLDGFAITAGYANGQDANRYGGGIFCMDSNSIKVSNCIIIENEALIYGGGIYDYNSSSLMITNSTFNDNKARNGGGMYNEFSTASVINCIFTDNTVVYDGGGMYNEQSSPTLVNCTFTANTNESDLPYYGGGGMYNNQSSPTLINCTFSDNSVGRGGKGGAIYNTNSSEPNMTNSIFGNNSAWNGGAVYNDDSEPNITYCIFTENNAIDYGGAVYSVASSPKIANSIFTGNTVDPEGVSLGAGIHNYQSSATIDNCIFSGNISDYGCGISNYQCSTTTIITNCIFTGNHANVWGGGVANCENISLLANCTFSGNRAYYGGGTYNWYNSDSNFINCIFWNNEANYEDDIWNNSALSVTYCDIKGDWAGGAGNIDQDPCFFEVDTPTGSWTANASYDESTFQSTLTDTGASWTVNQLAGKFINPDSSQKLHFFIVSNDDNTINVWSDVESFVISGDPYQIYDYHLKVESPCIDAGYPQGDYNGWKDIDGEPRVFDGDYNDTEIVDMGADEYYWSPADFDSDGLVNFFDYSLIANVWLTDPNDQVYNDVYDLIDNNCIDSSDLARFCEDWLWQTAWAKTFPFAYYQAMGRGMGKSMGESPGLTQELSMSVSARQDQPELTAADIEEIIKWLYDLWLTEDELRKIMTADDWLKFIERVENSK